MYTEVEGVGKQSLLTGSGGWMLPDAARQGMFQESRMDNVVN